MSVGPRCPNCGGGRSLVRDSRHSATINATRRRRQCQDCQTRFRTYEQIGDEPVPNSGEVEPIEIDAKLAKAASLIRSVRALWNGSEEDDA